MGSARWCELPVGAVLRRRPPSRGCGSVADRLHVVAARGTTYRRRRGERPAAAFARSSARSGNLNRRPQTRRPLGQFDLAKSRSARKARSRDWHYLPRGIPCDGRAGSHGRRRVPLTAGRNWDEYDESDCSMDSTSETRQDLGRFRATDDIGAMIARSQPAPEPAAAASPFLIKRADEDNWQPLEEEEKNHCG